MAFDSQINTTGTMSMRLGFLSGSQALQKTSHGGECRAAGDGIHVFQHRAVKWTFVARAEIHQGRTGFTPGVFE